MQRRAIVWRVVAGMYHRTILSFWTFSLETLQAANKLFYLVQSFLVFCLLFFVNCSLLLCSCERREVANT